MGLDWAPESISSMRDRYKRAVEKVWLVPKAKEDMKDRPGLHRDHVFDFEDGIRLLISNDKIFGDDESTIHISASYEDRKPGAVVIFEEMQQSVLDKWRTISGCGEKFHLHLIGVSPSNVPHWYVCGGKDYEPTGRRAS